MVRNILLSSFSNHVTGFVQTPFLSLDMNGLAAQLSKAKLSERVFIELPVELVLGFLTYNFCLLFVLVLYLFTGFDNTWIEFLNEINIVSLCNHVSVVLDLLPVGLVMKFCTFNFC